MRLATRARGLGIAVLGGVLLATINPAPAPTSAATPAERVIAVAKAQLGDPWVWAATGPNAFDCSGLVIYSYRQAGYGHLIGDGSLRSGYALLSHFRSRGLTSGSGRPGDIVVYGGGSHVGIYLGNGQVISTLTSGVRIHGLHAVTAGFTTFLRTGISGAVSTSSSTGSSWGIYDNVDHYRWTSQKTYMQSGPGSHYRTSAVLPAGDKILVTKSTRDGYGRTWYWAWSWTAGRSGWVAGWVAKA